MNARFLARSCVAALLASLTCPASGRPSAAARPRAGAADVALRDFDGHSVSPLRAHGARGVCLLFIAHDCPIANGYAPEIARICRRYAARGMRFYIVYSEPGLSAAAARAHAKAYGLLGAPCTPLLDPDAKLARTAGATVTPEAVVFGRDGRLRYRGRIDNLYLDLGRPRFAATTHDLRNALDAVLQGRSARPAYTRAIGCFIVGAT